MILVIQTYSQSYEIQAILTTLGIPHKTAWWFETNALRTPDGTFHPTSADCRNYLRQFKAVFLNSFQSADSNWSAQNASINTWLGWRAPQDPPIFHFGCALSTGRGLTPPADFPIVLADLNALSSTVWRWEAEVDTTSGYAPRSRIGVRVRLLRENRSVYTRAVNLFWAGTQGREAGSYLVSLAKLSALGANGEVLAIPDFPDQSRLPLPPAGFIPAFAVRYYNHFFMPRYEIGGATRITSYHDPFPIPKSIFWVLYALKLAQVKPLLQIPIVHEFDHWVETISGHPLTPRRVEQLVNLLESYAWLRDFGRARNLCIPFGNRAGGRYNPYSGDWDALTRTNMYDAGDGLVGQQRARQILDLLLDAPDVFMLNIHDHSVPAVNGQGFNNSRGGIWSNFRRHTDPYWQYEAPTRVPIAHGTVYKRGHAPLASNAPDGATRFCFARNGIEFLDVVPTTTIAEQFAIRDGTVYMARLVLERDLAEAHLLGFVEWGHGWRYTNNAGNLHGGEGYWETWAELGFRGLRADIGINQRPPAGDPRQMYYRGLQFVPSTNTDFSRGVQPGLYLPSHSAQSAVQYWGLDLLGEIVSFWETEYPIRGTIAVRRLLGTIVDTSLWMAGVLRGTTYSHPIGTAPCAPSNPLQRALSGADYTGRFNYIVEFFSAIDEAVQVLSDYVKWGTIHELLDLRDYHAYPAV